jgi:glycosyltransferase involved in cell wall biosynthesis
MKVSVLIPTHNRREVVTHAIDSVRNQTHKDLEIVVYDDGSIDGTEDVIRAIPDQRIVFIRSRKNKGLGHARNALVEAASCDIVAHHDDDDMSHPQRIELELKALEEYESIWVACTRYNFRPDETPDWKMYDTKVLPPLAKTREFAIHASVLMRKHYTLPYDTTGPHDNDLRWIREMWRRYERPLTVLEAPLYAIRYGMPDAICGRRRGMQGWYSKMIEGPMPNEQS